MITVDMAEPAAPETACPRAGKAGPPRREVLDSSSIALWYSSNASWNRLLVQVRGIEKSESPDLCRTRAPY